MAASTWYDASTMIEKAKEPEVCECPTCGCKFFEQIEVHQFPKNHNVILGQKVAPLADIGFIVLRCLRCEDVMEPQVQTGARDLARKMYNEFLDTMQTPFDKNLAKKPKPENL